MLFGEWDFSGVGNEHFYTAGQDSPPITRVSPEDLVERVEQSIHCGDTKQDERRGNVFGIIGDTGDIIPRDNSARHSFVLRDLIPQNVFKYLVIVQLKMCTTGKFFSKICLKATRNTFFQCCLQSRERWGAAWRKVRGINFLV